MEIPCDTTPRPGGHRPPERRRLHRLKPHHLHPCARRDGPGALGPERAVAELDVGELAGWFVRTRDAHMPATWNRDRVIVRAFICHLQAHGAALELPALSHRRIRPDSTRALSRAEVARILAAPAPLREPLREKTLWRLLYESAARVGEAAAPRYRPGPAPRRR
jgi:integrase